MARLPVPVARASGGPLPRPEGLMARAVALGALALAVGLAAACGGPEDPVAPDADALASKSCRFPGRPCDDGNPCTYGDTCTRQRTCVGKPYVCDDGNACTADSCDGAGGCLHVPTTGPCDDGNACTAHDVCADGVCAGAGYSCDDGNACTADACDGAGGCLHAPTLAACDDGNACTVGDRCSVGGVCAGVVPREICDNGVDDDCDGLVDAADPDCARTCLPAPETACDNGVDDDCDGVADAADPDCQNCQPGPETACDDGADNDCDGLVDSTDPDCPPQRCDAYECPQTHICYPDGYCYPHCGDGLPNGDEADVDCGGSCAAKCANGWQCYGAWDCASGLCVDGVCTRVP